MMYQAPSKKTTGNSTNTQQVKVNNNKFYLFFKRVFDFTAALLGIVILVPIFVLVALLVKLDDFNGPILFKQIRIGKNGKKFYIYKFRSMVINAEELKSTIGYLNEASGPVFKIKQDPRVTKVGRFIRKTSLDELPQLINVLKGDMSLVGPRPALPEEVDKYTSYEKQRLNVVPGLTCYWQVSGRSNIDFTEWMRLDMEYIGKRNFWVDLKLIMKTVFILFGSKGAY